MDYNIIGKLDVDEITYIDRSDLADQLPVRKPVRASEEFVRSLYGKEEVKV